MRWVVAYTVLAEHDLRDIYSYIAEGLMAPRTAAELVEHMMEEIKALSIMPKRFRLCEKTSWNEQGMRIMPINKYVVLYIPDDVTHTVKIIRILYGGRNIENIDIDSDYISQC